MACGQTAEYHKSRVTLTECELMRLPVTSANKADQSILS